MLTLIVYALVALIVVGALVVLAVFVLPGTEQLAPAPADRTPWALPADRAMSEGDVTTLKLPVTLRGYRFAETDAVLDRLGAEITYRDQLISELLAQLEQTGRVDPDDDRDGPADRDIAASEAAPVPELDPVPAIDPLPEPALVPAVDPLPELDPLPMAGPALAADEPLTELGETPEETDGPASARDLRVPQPGSGLPPAP